MMTVTTLPATTDVRPDDTTFTDVLRSEWIKFRSVGSTRWTLLAAWAGTIAVGLIVCAAIAGHWNQMSATDRLSFDPTFRSLTGLSVGQLAVGILGVLVIASEYATGMIRSTLAAVPGRRRVLAAKSLVLAAPTFVIATAASAVAFLGGQALLASTGAGASIWANGELRAVIGGGVYLTLMAVFGLALGAIFRRTAGGIAAFVGLVLVLPIVVAPLPNPWGRDISQYLPSDAGQAFLQIHTSAGSLPPWAGLAVLAAWVAAALGLAAWLITRRDV
jgi:hypothetical protein